MKNTLKRSMAAFFTVIFLAGICFGITVHAAESSNVYNWGERGQTATYLSESALRFYEDNQIIYEDLSLLSGADTLEDVPSSSLYGALNSLMEDNHSHITTYEETKDLFRYTDCQNGTGSISSFYSAVSIGPDWDGTWTREHTWPNSKGLDGDDENDIMMLRPAASTENSARGNTAYGESDSFYHPNAESDYTFDLRGDVARIMLYVYVRWENTDKMWGSEGVIESKEILLNWIHEDPVDTWELGRNDAVQAITGTRNVFVDYPEFSFLLFNEAIPENWVTPSGQANPSAYTITAESNNEDWGTVMVSGKYINAFPADGYITAGYQITAGQAQVSICDNTILVEAKSDTTVQVIFEKTNDVTATFIDNLTPLSGIDTYSGGQIVFPEYSGSTEGLYTFVGWTDSETVNSAVPPVLYQPGDIYTVSADASFYAVFSYVATGDSTGMWRLVTDESQLMDQDKIIWAANSKNIVASSISGSYLTNTTAAFSSDYELINSLPDDVLVLTLGGEPRAWTFAREDGKLLGATALKKLAFGSGTTGWSITIADHNATIQNATSSYGRILYNVTNPRFTTYTSNTNNNMLLPQLYKLDTASGTVCYTTLLCEHSNTEPVDQVLPDCTAQGYSVGVLCRDCLVYIEGHLPIDALGHDYNCIITPPTATTDGYSTYTCSNCADTYIDDYVPALGETYVVSFHVPEGVSPIDAMSCNSAGMILPEAAVPENYSFNCTFVGWTTAPLSETQDFPEYLNAGDVFTTDSDTELYALYKYCFGGTGESSFVLVRSAEQLKLNSPVLIVSAEYEYALSITQNGNNRAPADITKTETGTIDPGDNVAQFILRSGLSEGTYAFYCTANNGYLYAASNVNNYLRTKSELDANGSFAIVFDENGICSVIAQGDHQKNNLQYNSYNNIFSCYSTTQTPVSLYMETVDGTVFYSANPTSHHHEYSAAVTVPTCVDSGYTTYTCLCGDRYIADEIAATGHSYGAWYPDGDDMERRDCEHCSVYETRAVVVIAPEAPAAKVSGVSSSGKNKVSWNKVDGAVKYQVYRATSKSGTYKLVKTTTSTSYTHTSGTAGKTYYYKVRAVAENGVKSSYSSIVSRTCDLARPTVKVTNVSSSGKIKVSWNQVEGAKEYKVYRATSKTGTYKLMKTTTSTSYTNTSATAGKTYYYKVKAVHENSSANSAYSEIVSRRCDLPRPVVSIKLSKGDPKLSWSKISGAKEYKIYRATSKSGTYKLIKTTTSTSYTDTSAKAGRTYYYKVVAVHKTSSANSAYSLIDSIKAK